MCVCVFIETSLDALIAPSQACSLFHSPASSNTFHYCRFWLHFRLGSGGGESKSVRWTREREMVAERKRWMRMMRDTGCRKRGRADQGERRPDRQREFKRETDREKQEKPRERTSGGAYYTAVTPLRCSREWEELSTHYSSDLGGQLEESSINQTDAQAEADDSRQQCPQQQPPLHLHQQHTHTLIPHTHIYFPCTFICILPLASFDFLSVSVAFCISPPSLLFVLVLSIPRFPHHPSLSILLFVCPKPSLDLQLQTVN